MRTSLNIVLLPVVLAAISACGGSGKHRGGGTEGSGGSGGSESSGGSGTGGAQASGGSGGSGGSSAASGGSGGGGTGGSGTGGSATGGSGGTGASGGSGGTGGGAGGAGECDPECDGDTPVCEDGACVECASDSTQCADELTPQVCEDGEWVTQDECSGDTPLCIGGACSAVVVNGGLASQRASTESGSIRLVDHGFEAVTTLCEQVDDQTVCVTGGIRP